MNSTPRIFVSHAAIDSILIDEFVDKVLKLGSEVARERIFYTSGQDTGVPSGEDLNSYVRKNVSDAGIVIAIVTPNFQTRPYCLAELGAAWSRVDNLFPLKHPGMARGDLEGVLNGITIRDLNDSGALDELHDRITRVTGHRPNASTWGQYKQRYLASFDDLLRSIPEARSIRTEDYDTLAKELADARAALGGVQTELREQQARLQAVLEAKTAEAAQSAAMPSDERKQFEQIESEARHALGRLDSVARDVLWYTMYVGGMPWPNRFEESYRFDRVQELRIAGILLEDSDEELETNPEFPDVEDAQKAVERLASFLQDASQEFDSWFRTEYRLPSDLTKKAVWDELFP